MAVLIDIDGTLIDYALYATNLIYMNLPLESEARQAVAWFLTTAYSITWKSRLTGKKSSIQLTRELIQAELNIFKESKYSNIANKVETAINFMLI